MYETEVKSELNDKTYSRCRACLSADRRLLPVGKYLQIFRQLLPDVINYTSTSYEELLLCWECHNHLHKAVQFQKKVRKASEMIQLGQSYIYGTLSSLTTVVSNDSHSHTIYVNETNIKTDIGSNNLKIPTSYTETNIVNDNQQTPKQINDTLEAQKENYLLGEDLSNIDEKNDFDSDLGDKSVKEEENFVNAHTMKTQVIDLNKKASKANNKWAKRRALQNKKPKFKIVPHKELMSDTVFKRVQLDVEQLKEWMKAKREEESYKTSKFKCEDCIVAFRNDIKLMKHKHQCHEEDMRPYKCDVCNTRFSMKKQILVHMKTHYVKYECSLCQFSCSAKKCIRKHTSIEHRKIFQCLKCELKFGCRKEFFKHFKEWHEKFICDHCGIGFKMRYCIKDHLRKSHSTFECKPCGKRFARYNGLWLHKKVRHSPPAPAAYCVECDKHYPDIYRYRWHLANSARHNPKKKRKIPCPSCDKVFSKNIYMKDHYNLVHLKQYKYRCEECDKNFIRNADLVKHKKRTHEGILPPKNKICYVCGKGFTTNKILSNHVRTHTGERPHTCSACPARFAQRTTLRGHARAHHPTPAEV